MRRMLIAAALAGCDEAVPDLDVRLCSDFDGQIALESETVCNLDLEGHTIMIGQSPEAAFYRDPAGRNEVLAGATIGKRYTWTEDSAAGVALLVGETLASFQGLAGADRTCAWVRCE